MPPTQAAPSHESAGGDGRVVAGASHDPDRFASGERLVLPTKAIRVMEALRRGLAELDRGRLDDDARRRLVAVHRATLIEAASTVSDPLIAEMVALHIEPLAPTATIDQLRVAEAQLLGWVNGMVVAEAGSKDPVVIGTCLAAGQVPAEDEG